MPEKKSSSEKILVSKERWYLIGLLITLLNPIFAGLIIGFGFLKEPALVREGKMILILSLIWGAVSLALSAKFSGLLFSQ